MSSTMPCSGDGVNFTAWARLRLRLLLMESDHPSWSRTYTTVLEEIFRDSHIKNFLRCPCNPCHETRRQQVPVLGEDEIAYWLGKLRRSLRLFATCIISDYPLLIYPFLQSGFEDVEFEECMLEDELMTQTNISADQAKELLKSKEAFFDGRRVNLFDYLRLTANSPCPQPSERKWLQEEMLALLEKLALPEEACARRLPRDTRIGDITIKDLRNRTEGDVEGASRSSIEEPIQVRVYRDMPVSMRSLGCLMVDVIFFLLVGYHGVSWLDRNRLANVEWLKDLLTKDLYTRPKPFLNEIDKDTELKRAFELAWVMACPNDNFGFRKDNEGKDDYGTLSQHFRRTWQSTLYPPINDEETERSSEAATFSSRSVRPPRSSDYREIAPDIFRWMQVSLQDQSFRLLTCPSLLQYGAENEVYKRCWLHLFKTEDNSFIRIDRYRFDKINRDQKVAVKCSSFTAHVTDLRFVPLYAYGYDKGHLSFSAKLESHSHSSNKENVPPVFTFQTLEDVKMFQTKVTGRITEQEMPLSYILLEKNNQLLSRWKENNLPPPANFGRIQLWQILDDDMLNHFYESERMAQRGGKKPFLRLEIALFSQNFLVVLRVKSRLVLRILPNGSIRIEGSSSGKDQVLEGFCQLTEESIRNTATGQHSIQFPSLQLFQKVPVERPPDAKKLRCDIIELSFHSDEDKHDLCKFLVERYHAQLIGPA